MHYMPPDGAFALAVRDVRDAGALEVVSLRTLTSKTVSRGEGRYRLIVGQQIKHVPRDVQAFMACRAWGRELDYQGGWDEIDPTLTFDAVSGRYVNGPGWYSVEIDPTTPAIHYRSRIGGEAVMRLQETGGTFSLIPEGARWTDVCPGLDIELHLKPAGVEWFKRVKTDDAPKSWTWIRDTSPHPAFTCGWQTRGWDNADGAERTDEVLWLRKCRPLRLRPVERTVETLPNGWTRETVTETWTGETVAEAPITRQRSLSRDVVYPVWIDQDITEPIAADGDDVEENAIASTVSNVGHATYGNLNRGGVYSFHSGWRFTTVALTQGTTIDLANLKITVPFVNAGGVTSSVSADDVDSAAAWSNSSRPSQVTSTTANASFAQTSTGAKTLAVTSIVQEIVDRVGWAQGAIRFACLGHSGAGATNARNDDLGTSSGVEAVLEVDYTDPAVGGQPTMRRWGGVPHMGKLGGGGRGGPWG